MAVDDITVRLLTVLNAVNSKRPIDGLELSASERPAKLNRKKAVVMSERTDVPSNTEIAPGAEKIPDELKEMFAIEKMEEIEASTCTKSGCI
jgi:hypothetical protein